MTGKKDLKKFGAKFVTKFVTKCVAKFVPVSSKIRDRILVAVKIM